MYRFADVAVKISGNYQGLVQSVGVRADTGLDFVNINGSIVDLNKDNNIVLDITYLSNGDFVHPTSCFFYNSFGDIHVIRRNDDDILFTGCILIGTQSSIDANAGFGNCTETYRALGYVIQSGVNTFSGALTDANHTQPYAEKGSALPFMRMCHTTGTDTPPRSVSYESACTINRELLHQPGRDRPTHSCIQYPIVTTSKYKAIEENPSNLIRMQGKEDCPFTDAELYTYGGDLKNITIEGGTTAGEHQMITYEFESIGLSGLNRIINL